ncbi:MAG: hypothetical protein ABSA92_14650 [Candidatus Bathyarchaeia archaeon]
MRDNLLAVFRKSKPNRLETSLDVNASHPNTWLKAIKNWFVTSCERDLTGCGRTSPNPSKLAIAKGNHVIICQAETQKPTLHPITLV